MFEISSFVFFLRRAFFGIIKKRGIPKKHFFCCCVFNSVFLNVCLGPNQGDSLWALTGPNNQAESPVAWRAVGCCAVRGVALFRDINTCIGDVKLTTTLSGIYRNPLWPHRCMCPYHNRHMGPSMA